MAMCSCGDSDPKPGPGTPDKPVTPDTPAETKDVRVITTTSNRSLDLAESSLSFSKSDNMSPSTIRLNPTENSRQWTASAWPSPALHATT